MPWTLFSGASQVTASTLSRNSLRSFYKPSGKKAAGFSTSSGSPSPSGPGTQQSIWYRFRTAIATLLVLNGLIIGYTLFQTKSSPQISEGVQSVKEVTSEHKGDGKLKEAEKDKEKIVTENATHNPSFQTQAVSSEMQNHPELSRDQQQELFKWILAEKRKVKPANAIEKAQIDQEKALLKQYIRGKKSITG